LKRPSAKCDREDVLLEPVAKTTATTAATAMSPTTAVSRRLVMWIPLDSIRAY
jgi:hypothetical protein